MYASSIRIGSVCYLSMSTWSPRHCMSRSRRRILALCNVHGGFGAFMNFSCRRFCIQLWMWIVGLLSVLYSASWKITGQTDSMEFCTISISMNTQTTTLQLVFFDCVIIIYTRWVDNTSSLMKIDVDMMGSSLVSLLFL